MDTGGGDDAPSDVAPPDVAPSDVAPPALLNVKEEQKLIADLGRKTIMPFLPRLQVGGTFTLNRASVSVLKARSLFAAAFPHAPTFTPPSAPNRARGIIDASQTPTLTLEEREAIRDAYVTGSVTFLIFVHELVSHDELARHERHRVYNDSGEFVGVKVACPGCSSNDFVLTPTSTHMKGYVVNDDSKIRRFHGYRHIMVPFGGKSGCCNPGCKDVINRFEKAGIKPPELPDSLDPDFDKTMQKIAQSVIRLKMIVEITPWSAYCMASLPIDVQDKYTAIELEKGGADGELSDFLLSSDDPRETDVATVAAQYAADEALLLQLYINMATEQREEEATAPRAHAQGTIVAAFSRATGSINQTTDAPTALRPPPPKWPRWKFRCPTGLLRSPSTDFLASYFDELYAKIELHIDDDMFARSPGTMFSIDATYKAPGRTTDLDIGALTFSIGDDGTCHAFWATETDNENALLSGLVRLRERCSRLGTLDRLVAANTDTCCCGSDDVTDHMFVRIFPNMARAPLCDGFHAAKDVGGAFNPGSNLTSLGMMKGRVGKIFRYPNMDDLGPIVAWLGRRPTGPQLHGDAALKKALSKDFGSNRRTIGRESDAIVAELEQLKVDLVALSADQVQRGECGGGVKLCYLSDVMFYVSAGPRASSEFLSVRIRA